MWQLHAFDALDIARDRQLGEAHRRRLRHPGAIEDELIYLGVQGYPSNGHRADRGPGRIRRATARAAAAVSVRAAGLARSLDAGSLDGDQVPQPRA